MGLVAPRGRSRWALSGGGRPTPSAASAHFHSLTLGPTQRSRPTRGGWHAPSPRRQHPLRSLTLGPHPAQADTQGICRQGRGRPFFREPAIHTNAAETQGSPASRPWRCPRGGSPPGQEDSAGDGSSASRRPPRTTGPSACARPPAHPFSGLFPSWGRSALQPGRESPQPNVPLTPPGPPRSSRTRRPVGASPPQTRRR